MDVTPLELSRCHAEHRRTLEILDVGVAFASDVRRGVEIVDAVFGQQCRVIGDAPVDRIGHRTTETDWTVSCCRLPDFNRRYADLSAQAGADGMAVRRWKGDDEALRIDFDQGVSLIVHRQPFRGLTWFDRIRRVSTYFRPDDEVNVPHTEHLLKYSARVGLRMRGCAEIHAATCRYRDTGLLLMGYRRSGKSTLAMQLVTQGGRLIGNDLALVDLRGDVPTMVAMPHMTRIGPGTVTDNPVLERAFAAHLRTGDYLQSAVFNDGKEEVYGPALRSLLGDIAIAASPLDLILMPRLNLSRTDVIVTELRRNEALAIVSARLVDDPPLPEWLPFTPDGKLATCDRSNAEALLRRLPPVFSIEFGPYSSNPVRAVDRTIAALAGAPKATR